MRFPARLAIVAALLLSSSAALLFSVSQRESTRATAFDQTARLNLSIAPHVEEPKQISIPPAGELDAGAENASPPGAPTSNNSLGSSQAESEAAGREKAHRDTPLAFRPAPRATFVPIALRVPAIGVDAPVIRVGVDEHGRMAAPAGYEEVGWYAPGPAPGTAGRAVIAGHVDSPTSPAVFYDLERLQPGDLIHVLTADGSEQVFKVRDTQLYWESEAPLQEIFRVDGPPELVLITCGGEFDRGSAMYLQRRVVYAELVS